MQKKVVTNTFEKLGELVKDSAKAVATEPGKVLENVLGGDDSLGEEQGVSSGSQPISQKKSKRVDPLITKKRKQDKERTQKLLQLHRQRLKEEEAYQERTITEEEREEEMEIRKKEEEEDKRIIQLQKQEAKDAVLNAPTATSAKGPQGPLAAAKNKKGTKELRRQKD